jgi:hypothetical protein
VNKRGTPENLIPAHPGNSNATRYGVHSPRMIQQRAAEIEAELVRSFDFSPSERLAVREAARLIAILDAIERDLDDRGLLDKNGKPRYLLDYHLRYSRQLERWLTKFSTAIERQSAPDVSTVDPFAYIQELRRIALGHDSSASGHDRLYALRELIRIGDGGRDGSNDEPLPDWGDVFDALIAARSTASSYRDLNEMLFAELEDGSPDHVARSVGADVIRELRKKYPAFEREIYEGFLQDGELPMRLPPSSETI